MVPYVGLTRHREGVSLHYGRDDFRDGKGLSWSLGRERAKDTTLDYATGPGDGSDHQAGFAERRGIVPRSDIVVPSVERPTAEAATAERAPARERPQRGMFAGLKLERGADRGQERVREGAEGQVPVSRSTFAGLRIGQEQGRVYRGDLDERAATIRMRQLRSRRGDDDGLGHHRASCFRC